jgi:hypothetical protein
MSAGKVKARPKAADKHKPTLSEEIRDLQKTHALLVAVQFAAIQDCDFDASDALAVIRDRVEESLDRLDRIEVRHD